MRVEIDELLLPTLSGSYTIKVSIEADDSELSVDTGLEVGYGELANPYLHVFDNSICGPGLALYTQQATHNSSSDSELVIEVLSRASKTDETEVFGRDTIELVCRSV